MRSALIVAAVAGLVTAGPVAPRDTSAQDGIDLSIFDAEPKPTKVGPAVGVNHEPPTYNQAEAQASALQDAVANPVISARSELVARASTCTNSNQEPDGYGPVPSPDTYDSFMSWTALDDIANNAVVPQGYSLVFGDKQASVEGSGYQGLYTLTSYNPIQCQQYCDAAPACYGFNLFMERNPKFTPSDTCVDPESITNYKCTLWGAGVSEASATNQGQWRNQFHVGVAGSNGYNKNSPPDSIANFDGPFALGGAIQAPNSYIGAKYYPGVYDPGQCAAACQATTQYDHDHPRSDGTYDACNFFNAYVLSQNNVPQGTYCSLYTTSWDKSYSTNYGQYRGDDYFSVSQSYSYKLTVQDSGNVNAAPPS
ncbi:hypothetical protein CH063_13409 [Colletotrichum higginsianum]|uniref:Carbohydrate-binding-like protein n=1 Tax=Colletotrichum higginsianum (strain IMI 349063) TaxID=759273 RepID=H1VUA3_COLHI|nr:hypothetical protein CH63R_11952 [Colletotrichum higginsianum IMI 349063]OBR05249.1 hypothetical protein CH63R_11952 [Colletotrichum higginsianum IMI 349063]CCF43812.1 hypothetical protein CH063_13409 [Colletotrichum higginsianum]